MTKVLIVEDDPAQSRLLKKAISRRRPDYSVICSANGREAISVLEAEDIDLVLTDLQMSEMNGFELLAWLVTNRPTIMTFTMTAYGNAETQARLAALGSIECFTKPIDVAGIIRRFSESVAQSIRGHVQNVGLASFLQLLEMEQKTCTLSVRNHEQSGTLFIRKGELLDARLGERSGEDAAITIIGWFDPSITIDAGCNLTERVIERPMGFVVMEAMRLRDESVRNFPIVDTDISRSTIAPRESDFPPVVLNGGDATRTMTIPQPRSSQTGTQLGRGHVHAPAGAFLLAVVEAASGAVLACDGKERVAATEMASLASDIWRSAQHSAAACAGSEAVEELAITTRSRCDLMRPLPQSLGGFVMLVFDPSVMNLVIARLELDQASATYLATATMPS